MSSSWKILQRNRIFKDSSTLAVESHWISTELSIKKIQIYNIPDSLSITQSSEAGIDFITDYTTEVAKHWRQRLFSFPTLMEVSTPGDRNSFNWLFESTLATQINCSVRSDSTCSQASPESLFSGRPCFAQRMLCGQILVQSCYTR